jgi:hypothetical protein
LSVLKDIEIESISTLIPDMISFCTIGLCVLVLIKLQSIEMKNLNDYPNYLYIYFIHLVAPSLSTLGITTLFRKKELRRAVREEVENFLHNNIFS